MIRSLALSTSTALVLIACATTPKPDVAASPQPQPMASPAAMTTMPSSAFNPAGTWNFTADNQGQPITGTMVLTKAGDGTLGGEINSEIGTVTLTSLMVDGRKLTAAGVLPNGGPEIVFTFHFADADTFSGNFAVEGTTGAISGTRRKD